LQAFGTTQTWWSGQNGTDFGGWVVGNTSATADAGVWAPVAAFTPKNEELFLFPLSGDQVGYSNNGATLSQTLAANAQPNTEYVMSVSVGLRSEYFPSLFSGNYTLSLIAGTSVPTGTPAACAQTGAIYTPGSPCLLGQWTDNVFGSMHGAVGSGLPKFPLIQGGWQTIQFASQNLFVSGVPLIIQLSASGDQLDFENVTLQAFHVIPEPGTYALMGSALLVLGMVLRHRKKTV
jgi:hypothetical protein